MNDRIMDCIIYLLDAVLMIMCAFFCYKAGAPLMAIVAAVIALMHLMMAVMK